MSRTRWGSLAWLLTLQFFVAEALVEARYGPYSRIDDVISELGGGQSPAAAWMNASFLAQGVLITGGALLVRPALSRPAARAATVLLPVAGAGVLVVGLVPLDANGTLHALGAGLYLVGGGLGLLALAAALRGRSRVVRTVLAGLGALGTTATVLFVTGATGPLGVGGTERAAAYVLPIGLALAGALLARRPSSAVLGRLRTRGAQLSG